MADEEEEVGLILDGLREPLLLDHVLDFLHGRILRISGEVKEDAKRSDTTASGDKVMSQNARKRIAYTHFLVLNLTKRSPTGTLTGLWFSSKTVILTFEDK